jgi:hypothetical protein
MAQRSFQDSIASYKEDTIEYEAMNRARKNGTQPFDEFEKIYTIDRTDSALGTRMRSYEDAVKEAPKVYMKYRNAMNEAEEITTKKVTMKQAKAWLDDEIKHYDKYAREISENADKASNFVYATIPTSPKLMQAYAKELSKRGYNAAFDENTALASSAPFIVFDKNALELESTVNITKEANDYNHGR